MREQRLRVYLAHPMITYGSAREWDCLAALRVMLAGAELHDPARRYGSDEAWGRAWPRLLASLDGLVVFGTGSNVVGAGCLAELADARRFGVPVAMLDHRCRPRTVAGVTATNRPTAKRAAALLPGASIDLAELFGLRTRRLT
jgi:hypothetical protein